MLSRLLPKSCQLLTSRGAQYCGKYEGKAWLEKFVRTLNQARTERTIHCSGSSSAHNHHPERHNQVQEGRAPSRGSPAPLTQGSRCYSSSVVGEDGVVTSPYGNIQLITDKSLVEYLLPDFDKFGDSVALIDGVTGRQMTYIELKESIIKVASALNRLGLKKGDVLTIVAPNSIEYAVFYIAASATGAWVSAVNPLYTSDELAHAVEHSNSKYIVTIPPLVSVVKAARQSCPEVKDIIVFGESEGCLPISRLLEDDGGAFPDDVKINPLEDILALPYSSGTTGLPKGVMLTHSNIIANIEQMRHDPVLPYGQGDVLIGVLPMFHIYGQVVVLLSGLKGGSTIVTVPKFDPEMYLNAVTKYKATYLHIVPPIVLFLAKHPLVAKFEFPSVHTLFTGAAPVGAPVMEEAMLRFGKDTLFRQGYGLTEASPVTNVNPKDRDLIKFHTIGPALSNTELKVMDIETGEALPPGKEGELWAKGPQIMKGYFRNQEATADTLTDGWLHTGDIGHYDEDGHVVISDRLKELIKVKGFQVAPAELEALLLTHPGIQDSAVIGMPDEKAGELPRAYVVRKPNSSVTEEEIHAFLQDKVAQFKQLNGGIEFREEIPKSAAGKIMRRYLKEELMQKL